MINDEPKRRARQGRPWGKTTSQLEQGLFGATIRQLGAFIRVFSRGTGTTRNAGCFALAITTAPADAAHGRDDFHTTSVAKPPPSFSNHKF